MSRKNTLEEYQLVPTKPGATPVLTGSMSADFVTSPTKVVLGDSISYQTNITTTDSSGTFYAQASNDDVNWADVGIIAIASGANDTAIGDIQYADCFFYRVRYAHSTAGTGTCQILISWKAKGG